MPAKPLPAALLACTLCVIVPHAAAQYRQGTPPVLAPAPAADPAATAAQDANAFRAAYAKAGSPRITVYWNRQLSDSLATRYDQVQQAAVQTSSASVVQASPSGNTVAGAQQSTTVATLREGERALPDGNAQRVLLSEGSEWPIASAFNARLQQAGVRLVDRTMALRAQAAGESAESRRDLQAMEIKSLQGKSELLAEVLQAADPRAPFGVIFRVEIKDVASGELLASVVSEGKPPARGPGRFVAGANGFVREAAPEPSLADIGAVIADATLRALAARWH
jgi:hypothetical protein